MKNKVVALSVVLALIVSSVALALSLTPLFRTKSESDNPIPNEGFMGLGTRPGFGAGTFSLNPGESQIIFYNNLSIMGLEKETITVTNEGTAAGQNFDVEVYYWVVWRWWPVIPLPADLPFIFPPLPSDAWVLDARFSLGPRDSVTITAYSNFINYRTGQSVDTRLPSIVYPFVGDVFGVEVRVLGTGNATAVGYYFVHFFPK